jgi:VanZ family protein
MSFPLRDIWLSRTRFILWPLAVILAVLLFLGGPGYHSPRSTSAAWDLGHILLFFVWGSLLLTWKPVREAPPARQWGIAILFCVVGGVVTEGIQFLVGGDASLGDLLRDQVGGVIALSWVSPSSHILSRGRRRMVRGLSVVLLLVASLPLAVAVADEGIARAQFPLLADFETPFEKDRWEGGARASVDRSVSRHGNASLRVEMEPSLYSGISLVYFPRNWKNYHFLRLEVFNPASEEIPITCRIHDRRHEEGEQAYEDRFNRTLLLRPGWNGLGIDLSEVAGAPHSRKMDLGEIRGLGLFATKLSAPRTVFVDYVRLE